MRKESLRTVIAAALALTLIACGGGGSGGNGTPTGSSSGGGSQTYNLQAGIANMVAHGLTVNVTFSGTVQVNGTSTAVTGSGTYTLAAGVSATFNGTAATSQTQTLAGNVMADGQSIPVSQSVTDYYAASNSAFLGQVASGEYDVAQAQFEYPTSIEGGMSGTLGTVLRYTDSTMSVPQGTSQTTYAVTAATTQGGPLGVAITTKSYNTQNALVETDTTNYTMTSSNVISFVSAVSQAQQGTLTATAQ
jgi:hypothetical protein